MQINPAALKAIRENAGYSQLALSKEADVSQGHLSDIESSERPVNIRPATAKKLAEALRVPVAALTVPEVVAS